MQSNRRVTGSSGVERGTCNRSAGRRVTPKVVAGARRFRVLPAACAVVCAALAGAQALGADTWLLAGMPAVKVAVGEEGWYRVGQPALVAAGLPPGVRSSSLRLFAEGVEVPLRVASTGNNPFGPSSWIEFYATALDTPWSGTKVCWLTADLGAGARIAEVAGSSRKASTAVSFPCTVAVSPRTIYVSMLKNGDAGNFFGPVVTPFGAQVAVGSARVHLASLENAVLDVALQGASGGGHSVRVQLNGVDVGRLEFADMAASRAAFTVPASMLIDGDNQVYLAGEASLYDVTLVDTITLTYPHLFYAAGDELRCIASGGQLAAVRGFTTSDIIAIDITNPLQPVGLHCNVRPEAGAYTASFAPTVAGPRTIYVFAGGAVRQPSAVVPNVPSQLGRITGGAELVIITHADFAADMAPLVGLRAGQGWSVMVVDVQDIFDEYNYGHVSPYPIRDFLAGAAAVWTTAPSHVLLVGDASFDPRNFMGFGYYDFVPTKLVDAVFMETASDDWFADVDGDGTAELAIGRFPVRTAAQTAAVVAKLVARENVLQTNDVLLCAETETGGVDCEAASRALEALIPAPYTAHEIFESALGVAGVRAELLARWQQGPRFINHRGWSWVDFWWGYTLTGADAAALANGASLPVVASVCDLNCCFHDLPVTGLGETLLLAGGGGAAAVWGCSDFVDPASLGPMNEEFVRQIFGEPGVTVGQAAMAAKAKIGSVAARRSWVLLGDPAMRP